MIGWWFTNNILCLRLLPALMLAFDIVFHREMKCKMHKNVMLHLSWEHLTCKIWYCLAKGTSIYLNVSVSHEYRSFSKYTGFMIHCSRYNICFQHLSESFFAWFFTQKQYNRKVLSRFNVKPFNDTTYALNVLCYSVGLKIFETFQFSQGCGLCKNQ